MLRLHMLTIAVNQPEAEVRRDVTAPFRFPRFFVTNPSPCPYLPGRSERKVFTERSGENASELNDALGRIGFRRSQNVAYRPSCAGCTACVSVRVVTQEFRPNATQRKLLRRNEDLVVTACKPWSTEVQFDLLHRSRSDARRVGHGLSVRLNLSVRLIFITNN